MECGLCLLRGQPQTYVMQIHNKGQQPKGGVTIRMKRVTTLISSAGTGNRVFLVIACLPAVVVVVVAVV